MDLDDEQIDHIEQQSFANEVRDHEGLHKAFLLALFPLTLVCMFTSGPLIGSYVLGACLVGAGLTAMRGGRSRVTGLFGSDDPMLHRPTWSIEQLEHMAPSARKHHARVTGFWLLVLGLVAMGLATQHVVRNGF